MRSAAPACVAAAAAARPRGLGGSGGSGGSAGAVGALPLAAPRTQPRIRAARALSSAPTTTTTTTTSAPLDEQPERRERDAFPGRFKELGRGPSSPFVGGVGQFLPWPPEMCFTTGGMVVHGAAPLRAGNQYLVVCARTRDAVIVDHTDSSPMRWAAFAAREGANVKYIVHTDLTEDEVPRVAAAREVFNRCPVVAHPDAYAEADLHVRDGDVLTVGELKLRVLETPGVGTAGHLALYEPNEGVAWVGRLLTRGGFNHPVSKTPVAHDLRYQSLRRLVWTLPESCILMPSHYGVTYMAAERRSNPDLLGIDGPPLSELAPTPNPWRVGNAADRCFASMAAEDDDLDAAPNVDGSARSRTSWYSM